MTFNGCESCDHCKGFPGNCEIGDFRIDQFFYTKISLVGCKSYIDKNKVPWYMDLWFTIKDMINYIREVI